MKTHKETHQRKPAKNPKTISCASQPVSQLELVCARRSIESARVGSKKNICENTSEKYLIIRDLKSDSNFVTLFLSVKKSVDCG